MQMACASPLYLLETPSFILLANFSRLLDLLVNEAIAGGDMRDGEVLIETAAAGPFTVDGEADCGI